MRGRSALRLIMARSSLATPKHAVPLGPILDTCFRRRMFQKNTTHRFLLYWVSNSNRQHLLLSILGRQYHNMNTWYPIPICCALAKGHMFLFRIMSQETCLCYSAHIMTHSLATSAHGITLSKIMASEFGHHTLAWLHVVSILKHTCMLKSFSSTLKHPQQQQGLPIGP